MKADYPAKDKKKDELSLLLRNYLQHMQEGITFLYHKGLQAVFTPLLFLDSLVFKARVYLFNTP